MFIDINHCVFLFFYFSYPPLTMENIIQPNDSFDFSSISLAHPSGIQGGAYFTKITNNGKPLYIQTPKGLTKQGFIKNGKKIYADLMFDNNDDQFIHWLENLEIKCQELIFEKKNSWFENQLDKNDIETAFTSPIRVYKSGKFYLIRVNIKVSSTNNLPSIKIYNENETPLTIEDISNETNIISILEIQGIKFTSRNFQIEIELKQSMVLNNDALFESCLIKTNNKTQPVNVETNNKMLPYLNKEEPNLIINTNKTSIEVLERFSNEIIKNEKINNANTKNAPDVNLNYDNLRKENDNKVNKDLATKWEKNVEEFKEEEEDKDEDEDEEEDEEESHYHPPLTLGNEIKASTIIKQNNVRFKENGLSGLEEIDFDINDDNFEELAELAESEELKEVDIASDLNTLAKFSETMKLKKPNQVYYEIYKQARKKAKQAKKEAMLAFLEAKNIKKTYMLDDLDESDSDSSDLDNIEEMI